VEAAEGAQAARRQGRRVLGSRLAVFGQVAAGLLVLSLLFVPIIPLLVWAAVVGVISARARDTSKPHSVPTPARV
jgi:hypothetical protein